MRILSISLPLWVIGLSLGTNILFLGGCTASPVEQTTASTPQSQLADDTITSQKSHSAQSVATAIPQVDKNIVDHHRDSPNVLTFADALHRLRTTSAKLRANEADFKTKSLQREAVDDIHLPIISVSGTAMRYQVNADISTARVQERIDALGSRVDGLLEHLPKIPFLPPLPRLAHAGALLPDHIPLSHESSHIGASIHALWPVYTGGRLRAVQDFLGARAGEAESVLHRSEQTLYTTLVERYFGAQLAGIAEAVRAQAVHTIAQHDHMAQRFLAEGLIARTQRLTARAKLAEAKAALTTARHQRQLAQAGLAQMVGTAQPPLPATALFVNTHDLHPLVWYQEQALSHFPGFKQIDAKAREVKAAKTFSEAAFKPSVTVLGSREIKAHRADWLIGLNIRYTLLSNIDRRKLVDAADSQLEQVDAVRMQAQSDIRLLVEKTYLAVQDALSRFHTYHDRLALAREQARLATRSFAEGLATVLDVVDADTNLARVQTERAQAAYDYVLALAKLLESAGLSDTFIDYQINADIHLDEAGL